MLFVLTFLVGNFFINNTAFALITTDSVTVNGNPNISVDPNASISIAVTVNMTAQSNDWSSTSYAISSSLPDSYSCYNNPDHTGISTYTESFDVIAPSTPGTYNLYIRTHSTNSCGGTPQGTLYTLSNSVVVTPILVTGISVTGAGNAETISTDDGTLQMSAEILPTNATDKTVAWSVTPGTGTGSIDSSGLLTAISDGTVTVTATANDGSLITGAKDIIISNQLAQNPTLKDITSFIFPDLASGIISENTINVTVPLGTDVTNLTPTIILSGGTINPLSGIAQDFTNPVIYTVTASDNSTKEYTVTVTPSADPTENPIENKTIPDENGHANLGGEITKVIIGILDHDIVIDIADDTLNPTIDVSAFDDNKDGTMTLPQITINSNIANIIIPDGTIVTGYTDWDGIIQAPTISTSSEGKAPAKFKVGNTIISLGSLDGTLNFEKAVTIIIKNVTGTVGYKSPESNDWKEITNICDGSYDEPENPTEGECSISNGTDTKILTYHFTSFGELEPVKKNVSSGSIPMPISVSTTESELPERIGCEPGSGDLFNVNTGEPCDNVSVTVTVTTPTKEIPKETTTTATTTKIIPETIEPILSVIEMGEELENEKGTEKENILSASAGRINLILNGPMSVWIIILMVIIIITGGFGIYGIIDKKKNQKGNMEPIKKTEQTVSQQKNSQTPPIIATQPVVKTQPQPLNNSQTKPQPETNTSGNFTLGK